MAKDHGGQIRAVAILETMWQWCGLEADATPYFRINGDNHTGKRLYWLLGHYSLLVTNACKETVATANDHGTPNPEWLSKNLATLKTFSPELILVCGKVAQETFRKANFVRGHERVVFIPHPAARMWTRQALDETQRLIQSGGGNLHITIKKHAGVLVSEVA